MNKKHLQLRLKQISWVLLAFLVIFFVLSAVDRKKNTYSADIVNVKITNGSAVDSNLIIEDEVRNILDESFTYGITNNVLKEIDVSRAERILERNPFVTNADVYIDHRNQIHADIEQRVPMLRVIDGENKSYYLDAAGNYMPLSKHYTPRVLVLTGFVRPYESDFLGEDSNHHLKNLFTLATMIQKDEFYRHFIEQIHVSQNGDLLLVPKLGKQQILFGRYLNVTEKLQRLKIFYNEALPHEGWAKYELIDIRFNNQIVCTR